jgi:hypothetical protein
MRRITALLFVLALPLATAGAQGAKAPRDVVREYVRSSNDGNLDALLALFDREAAVFVRPDSLDRLAGPISDVMGTHAQRRAFWREAFARRPLPRTEVVHTLPVGDLTAVVTRTSNPPAFTAATYTLSIYRIRDGQIRDLWNVATSSAESPDNKPAEDAIRSFIVANNAGDTEAFLRHFSRDAKLFRASDDPRGLADKYSARMSTAEDARAPSPPRSRTARQTRLRSSASCRSAIWW